MKNAILAFAGLVTLSACGGGGTSPNQTATFNAAAGHRGDARGEIALNSAGDKIKVDIDGATATLDVGSATAAGTFRAGYQGGTESILAFVSETDASRAGLANYRTSGVSNNTAQFERLRTTEVPTQGSASATGDYVGLLTGNGGFRAGRITGDATVTANFTEGTVRGRVTDRTYGSAINGGAIASVQFGDLALNRTDLNQNGRFSGSVQGGGFTVNGVAATVNSAGYSGLVAGASGDEIVGAVEIDTTYNGSAFTEYGVFATGH